MRHPSAPGCPPGQATYTGLSVKSLHPVHWWIDHQQQFPRLSALALDILAIPAMAADCERSFSIAKLSVSSQRHSMNPETLEMLQLLKDWLQSGDVIAGGLFGSI